MTKTDLFFIPWHLLYIIPYKLEVNNPTNTIALREREREIRAMEFSCKAFKVGKCDGQKVVDGETMPLVLQPTEPNKGDMDSLLFALKENKDWFEQMIIKNSAVLLRGYNVNNAQDFNEILETFGWDDIPYVGRAPRTQVYKRVWTANEGPLSEFLFYHHEMVLVIYISLNSRSLFLLIFLFY
jgi:hypothetical protein